MQPTKHVQYVTLHHASIKCFQYLYYIHGMDKFLHAEQEVTSLGKK